MRKWRELLNFNPEPTRNRVKTSYPRLNKPPVETRCFLSRKPRTQENNSTRQGLDVVAPSEQGLTRSCSAGQGLDVVVPLEQGLTRGCFTGQGLHIVAPLEPDLASLIHWKRVFT